MTKPKQQSLTNVFAPFVSVLKRHLTLSTFVSFSAKNEAKHAVSIQEVTSLADGFDSPLICADLRVSLRSEP